MNDTTNAVLTNITSGSGVAAALEAKRLAEKYQKDFFDCEDLVGIMHVGRNNIRQLMRSKEFPTVEIGNRKVVSAISLALWLVEKNKANDLVFP
jgi:hypothetical protein